MKTIFFTPFLVLLLLLSAKSHAQPVIVSQRVAGGTGYDFFKSMYLTKDGGCIAGGYSNSDSGYEKSENSRGSDDYWVVKFNSFGHIEWDKTIGGSSPDYLYSLQQTNDGGYILGGYSWSDAGYEKTENSRGYTDYWIVKLDRLGNIEWDKTIGGSADENLKSLQQTSDGGYILGGSSDSDSGYEKSENHRGHYDYWVVKLDCLGNIEWDKTIGGSRDDNLYSLQQTSDGGYILGGYSDSDSGYEKSENPRGEDEDFMADYWVVKLDSLANIQWDKTIGGSRDDGLFSLQQTSDRGYILGGFSLSDSGYEKSENRRGDFWEDYWVVKLDSLANIEWDKTIGGNSSDNLRSLQQTSDGGYILGGYSTSDSGYEKTENSRGYNDYWIVKLDSSGYIQGDKTIGGADMDYLYSIKEVKPNYYLAGGNSLSGKSGNKTIGSRGYYDYWGLLLHNPLEDSLAPAFSVVSIDKMIAQQNGFTLYPNPAQQTLTINFNATKQGMYNLAITDMQGQYLITKKIEAATGTNRITIDISKFVTGIYIARLTDGANNSRVQKFIKQ